MKAPHCRICDSDHWSNQPHIWPGSKAPAKAAPDPAPIAKPKAQRKPPETVKAEIAAITAKPAKPRGRPRKAPLSPDEAKERHRARVAAYRAGERKRPPKPA